MACIAFDIMVFVHTEWVLGLSLLGMLTTTRHLGMTLTTEPAGSAKVSRLPVVRTVLSAKSTDDAESDDETSSGINAGPS